MKHIALFSSLAAAGLAAYGLVASANACSDELPIPGDTPAEAGEYVIELAVCLDTSGSMDGLINSARQKLWTIVNDLAKAEPTPELRVALLSFGNDSNSAENGWVQVETPFTEDLDTVSQMLFGLTTGGGTELVGRVVQTSLEQLDWHPSNDALRMIFVAGNESAEQDEEVAMRSICRQATERGIDVTSIYCAYGKDDSEVLPGWRELGRLGGGEFAEIDQDSGSVVIATPYDADLIKLSADLNETYIPFGNAGAAGCSNQLAQDANAAGLNTASAASRAATKAGKLYSCSSWDLVDAVRAGQVDLAEVAEEELPEDMREMTLAQRVAKVEEMQQSRSKLQKEIADLDQLRQAMLSKELARQATKSIGGFDLAIRNALRTRAQALGFRFAHESGGAPIPAGAALAPVPLGSMSSADSIEYFVQFGGATGKTTWVANDLAPDFDELREQNKAFAHDMQLSPGTPEAAALIESLPAQVRELVGSMDGMIYLRWQGKVYLVTGGC